MRFFDLNDEGKKTKMLKAWKLYKKGMGQLCSLDKVLAFMEENNDFLPKATVEELKVIGDNIGYLYH